MILRKFFLLGMSFIVSFYSFAYELSVDYYEFDDLLKPDRYLIEFQSEVDDVSNELLKVPITTGEKLSFIRNSVEEFPTITIRYEYSQNDLFDSVLNYQMMDSLFFDDDTHDIKFYFTKDLIWIESKKKDVKLGMVLVAPLHFGLGDEITLISENMDDIIEDIQLSNPNSDYINIYTFDENIVNEIRNNYTLKPVYPLQEFTNMSSGIMINITSSLM